MCVKEEPMKEKKQSTRKLPGKVIAAVTFNDLASNCMWMLINYYLLFFYTDVLLIPASAATVMLLSRRCAVVPALLLSLLLLLLPVGAAYAWM